MTRKEDQEITWGDRLLNRFIPPKEESPFLLSIIIPSFNSAHGISVTLDSIVRQKYEKIEVILVDAGSKDHTLEIASSFAPLTPRIYTVPEYHLYEMINRGITLASGRYITILFPGTLYLSEETYQVISSEITKRSEPDLLYTGSIQRSIKRAPRYVGFPFDLFLMERGFMPATLPSCFWRSDLFDKLGKFQTQYSDRACFDLLCHFAKEREKKELRAIFLDRVYVDYDDGRFSYLKLMDYIKDTWRILENYFGFRSALVWFLGISHYNIVRWWARHLKRRLIKI